MYGDTSRSDDPNWVYRSFLRALKSEQLLAHVMWQLERSGAGDPVEVADAVSRLGMIKDEFSRAGRPPPQRNGRTHPSAAGFAIDVPLKTEDL